MRHLMAFLTALVLLGFASFVLYSDHANRQPMTTVHLAFAGGCILLAFGMAAPANLGTALSTVGPYLPGIRSAVQGVTDHRERDG